MDRAKLKSCTDRIMRLLDQRDELLTDIRDIYTEAKGANIVPKVLRKVIARKRAKDPAGLILEDDLLDTYLAALDGPTRKAVEMAAQGATAREIEQATGLDHVTVSRSVSLKNKHETPHCPETGEVIESSGRPVQGLDGAATAAVRPLDTDAVVAALAEATGAGHPPGPSLATIQKAVAVAAADNRSFDEIAGPIPEHLRRRAAQ